MLDLSMQCSLANKLFTLKNNQKMTGCQNNYLSISDNGPHQGKQLNLKLCTSVWDGKWCTLSFGPRCKWGAPWINRRFLVSQIPISSKMESLEDYSQISTRSLIVTDYPAWQQLLKCIMTQDTRQSHF